MLEFWLKNFSEVSYIVTYSNKEAYLFVASKCGAVHAFYTRLSKEVETSWEFIQYFP